MEINYRKTTGIYLIFFCSILLIICSVNEPIPIGEWDDYSLPVASIFNDHNFSISNEDISAYKQLFPEWADSIDGYSLSGYTTRSRSGEMSWYFPTYALSCIPMVLLLKILNLPLIYAFCYTNLTVFAISLIFVLYRLNVDDQKKFLLILALSINPIIFYISWISAEVYIYSMLIIGLTCWHNTWNKLAAFYISIAGTLNPTIMSVGIIMVFEYFCIIIKSKDNLVSWKKYWYSLCPNIIKYGFCYIIGIIPMIYNYYNTGHINLTASNSSFIRGSESIFSRFLAYLFDLNFGILPYFTILFVLAFFFLVIATIRRYSKYLLLIIAFLLNMLLYSIMTHVNCGMSGIARYNAWNSVLLIFAVIVNYDSLLATNIFRRIIRCLFCFGIFLTGSIVFRYNPHLASNTDYIEMTPIAKSILDYAPSLYNPLYSTFNSRVTHQDGGYNFITESPIIYKGSDGYVRKILASSENREELLNNYTSLSDADDWLINQINSLDRTLSYISIPRKYKIVESKN